MSLFFSIVKNETHDGTSKYWEKKNHWHTTLNVETHLSVFLSTIHVVVETVLFTVK